jgi:hypothetical protein
MVEHRCVLVCWNEDKYSAGRFVTDNWRCDADESLARSFVTSLGVSG